MAGRPRCNARAPARLGFEEQIQNVNNAAQDAEDHVEAHDEVSENGEAASQGNHVVAE